jgi:hypothetical protein
MKLKRGRLGFSAVCAVGLCLVASACDAPSQPEKKQAPSDPVKLVETKTVVPGTMFATYDPSNGYPAMQSAAKSACGNEGICKVVIFPVGTVLPTQFPMTDREAEEQIGTYTLNRNSGADELIANCKIVKDTPKQFCG